MKVAFDCYIHTHVHKALTCPRLNHIGNDGQSQMLKRVLGSETLLVRLWSISALIMCRRMDRLDHLTLSTNLHAVLAGTDKSFMYKHSM
jgi:hypothetical protein